MSIHFVNGVAIYKQLWGARTMNYGYGKILDVDLSIPRITRRDVDPLFAEKYIGGMGFSCKILYDEVKPDVDPLSPQNVVVFANGPLTGTGTPCSGRTEITTKSPLTRHIGTGNTGGLWGARLKHAGFDLIIVRGQSPKPVYLRIDDQVVEIRDASHIWGKDTKETTIALQEEIAPSHPSKVSILTIGQGGENLVKYACPVNDLHHVAARSGAGCVMGAKKLKAIAVRGSGTVPIAEPFKFDQVVRGARARLLAADKAAKAIGAPPDVRISDLEDGCLPAKNFQTGILPQWAETRSAHAAQKYITGKEGTCYRCPTSCFNLAEVKAGKYAGTRSTRAGMPGVVFNFGAMCAIDNLPAIWKCKELCQRFGLDYESTGASIAFAMELYQRGLLTVETTDGIELTWGNEDAATHLIEKIACRDGFGSLLADGTLRTAKKIGGGADKCALTVKGMEMTMLPDPRAGTRLGWICGVLTNPRGGDNVKNTHIFAETYNPNWWVDDFDIFDIVKNDVYGMPPEEIPTTWQGKAMMCCWFEDLFSLCNALGFCFFTAGKLAWGPSTMSSLYSACTGRETSPEQMMKLGERILTIFKAFTIREGLGRKDDTLPTRFFEEPLPEGPAKGMVLSRKDVERFLDEYYELRGWDKKTGLPPAEKFDSLDLSDLGADLKEYQTLSQ